MTAPIQQALLMETGVAVSNEVSQFLARATAVRGSPLDSAHVAAYTALIDGLVADGIWTKLDVLHIYSTQDSATALLNLISSNYTGTAHGSPVFTTDQGYQGVAGSSTVYIDTNFDPVTAVSPNTGATFHASVWSVDNVAASSAGQAAGSFSTFGWGTLIAPHHPAGGGLCITVTGSTGQPNNYANSVTNGFYAVNRSGGNDTQVYQDGASKSTSTTDGYNGHQTQNYYTLAGNSNGTALGWNGLLGSFSIGGSLTSAEHTKLYNRERTFMTAVGVP